MQTYTVRRSLSELFKNRRRQNLGRFTALPAAIFRPIFLPFAGPCWWYFWFQMLQFYIWHSILLVVEPERTIIVRSGLVKKNPGKTALFWFKAHCYETKSRNLCPPFCVCAMGFMYLCSTKLKCRLEVCGCISSSARNSLDVSPVSPYNGLPVTWLFPFQCI